MKNRFIANAPLFSILTDDERRVLGDQFQIRQFAEGETLYSQGEMPQAMYLVKSGVVRLVESGTAGDKVLATLGPSSILGEIDLLLQRPYNATATARGNVDVWELTRARLSDLLRLYPQMSIRLSSFLGERIADVDQYLVARLRSVPMLVAVDDRSLYALAAGLELQTAKRGALIFQTGTPSDHFYFVESGTVTIVSTTPDDPEPFKQLGVGEVFGHEAMLRERPYGAVARATSDVQLWALSRAAWERVANSQPGVRQAVATYLRESTLAPADREAAGEAMARIPMFAELSPALRAQLVPKLTLRHVGTNEAVYSAGDPGTAFYLIDKGAVKILDDEALLERKEDGGWFGELALLTGKPHQYTVRAARPTNLWVLHKRDFDAIAVRYPELTATASRALAGLLAHDNEYSTNANLAMFPLFTGLTPREQADVARRLRTMYVTVNEVIFREGAVADALYLVKKGQVRLASPQGVFDLVRAGGFFGEMALLTRNNQNVTAQAVEDTELLVLDRAHFDAMVGKYPSVSLALSRALGARLETAEARGSVPMMTQYGSNRPSAIPTGNTLVADSPYTVATAIKMALVVLPLLWLIGVAAPYWVVNDAALNPTSPLYGILQGLGQ